MDSQCKQILEYLTMGGELTAMDALNMFRCWNTKARIHELRKNNNIETKMIEKNGKRFAKYKLIKYEPPVEKINGMNQYTFNDKL